MAFRQLEWLLRERLRAGLQTIRSNPTLIDAMFVDLSVATRTHFKEWLQNHEISILLGYPRGLEDVPCWVISMSGESPVQTPIGQLMNHSHTVGGEIDEKGELVRKTYQVFTMSQNPDLTIILSTILQHTLKSMREALDLDGFLQMSVAQQGPLDVRVDLLPNYLYSRITSIAVAVEDTFVQIDSALPEQFQFTLDVEIPLPPSVTGCHD